MPSTTQGSPSFAAPADSKASQDHYVLVSVHFSSTTPYNLAYHGRTLRYTGSGHFDIVPTEGKPVLLRFYLDVSHPPDAASSPALQHTDNLTAVSSKADARTSGFTIGDGMDGVGILVLDENSPYKVEQPLPGPIAVEMHPGIGDDDVQTEQQVRSTANKEAVLKWAPKSQEAQGWRGFILRDSPAELFKGNPRLFWDRGDGEMLIEGSGWARINSVREVLREFKSV